MKGTCKICNKEFDSNEYGKCDIRNYMEKYNVCFHCAFWIEKKKLTDKDTLITKNYHRFQGSIVDKRVIRMFLGFGGANQYFRMLSGEDKGKIRWYNNVWHQGLIPDYFKGSDCFEVNAEEVSEEEFKQNQLEILNSLEPGTFINVYEKYGKHYICYFTIINGEKCFYCVSTTYPCYENKMDLNKIYYLGDIITIIEPVDYESIPNVYLTPQNTLKISL